MTKGTEWSPESGWGTMGEDKLGKALQRINLRYSINPKETFTSDMGRKTFVTLSTRYMNFDKETVKMTTHHIDDKMVRTYQDPNYENLPQATIVGRAFQAHHQGRYTPAVVHRTDDYIYSMWNMMGVMMRAYVHQQNVMMRFLKQ